MNAELLFDHTTSATSERLHPMNEDCIRLTVTSKQQSGAIAVVTFSNGMMRYQTEHEHLLPFLKRLFQKDFSERINGAFVHARYGSIEAFQAAATYLRQIGFDVIWEIPALPTVMSWIPQPHLEA